MAQSKKSPKAVTVTWAGYLNTRTLRWGAFGPSGREYGRGDTEEIARAEMETALARLRRAA